MNLARKNFFKVGQPKYSYCLIKAYEIHLKNNILEI